MPLSGMPLNKGVLIVSAEELAVCLDEITLKFVGKSLDRKDWLGKYVSRKTYFIEYVCFFVFAFCIFRYSG